VDGLLSVDDTIQQR